MTATLTFDRPIAPTAVRPAASRFAAPAGLAYVGAWVFGLTAFGAGPAANASDTEIARYFGSHELVSVGQSLLIPVSPHGPLPIVLASGERGDRTKRQTGGRDSHCDGLGGEAAEARASKTRHDRAKLSDFGNIDVERT